MAISLPAVAVAAPITWDGDTSTDFAADLNWVDDLAPANDTTTDIATFNAGATFQPDLSTGSRSVNGLDFQTGNWTLSDASGVNALTLGGGGITSAGNNLITANLVPSVASTFSTLTGTTLTLNQIAPSPTNTVVTLGTTTNTGTISLEGTTDNNSFSPTLAYGTLLVNKTGTGVEGTSGSSTSNLTVSTGALVKYGPNLTSRAGRGQIYGALTLNGTATLDLNGQGLTTATTNNWVIGALNGDGFVTNTGSGTAQMAVRGGTFTGEINDGTQPTSLMVYTGTFNWSGLGNFSGDIVTNGTLNLTSLMGGGSYAKNISGTGGITFSAAGVQTLTGANTYTGLTTIATGATVKIGAGQASSLGATTGALTMGSGSTLDLNGESLTKGTLTANAASATVTSATPASLTCNYANTANLLAGLSLTDSASIIISGGIEGSNSMFGAGTIVTGTGSIGFQNQTGTGLLAPRFNDIGVNLGTNGDLRFNGGGRLQTSLAQSFGAGTDIIVNGLNNYWNWQNTTDIAGGLKGSGDLRWSFGGGNKFMTIGGDNTTFSGTITMDGADDRNATITLTSDSTIGLPMANVVMIGNTNPTWANTVLRYGGTLDATVPLGALSGTNAATFLENNTAATTATWQIGALNTDTTYPGTIRDGAGTTGLEKVGTETLTLSGTNTYTGPTTVTEGTLNVTGSLGATDVTVTDGTTIVVGNGSISSATVGNGATFSTADLATSTINVANDVTVGASGTSLMTFEAGVGSSDSLAITNNLVVDGGGVNITIDGLGIAAGSTHTLMTFAGGSGSGFTTGTGTTVGGITLTNPNISFGVTGSLEVDATSVKLVTGGSAAPTVAYWSGSKGTSWTSNSGGEGNFSTDAGGATFISANPGVDTDLFFSNNSPSNLDHTLGANFAVKSLTYLNSSAAVSTTGGNQLSIGAGGITMESGNGGATLGMSNIVLSDDQTWTNNEPSLLPLTVSANINDPSRSLTLAGDGLMILGGPSLTLGSIALNCAYLDLAGSSITAEIADSDGIYIYNEGAAATLNLSTSSVPVTLSTDIADAAGSIAITKAGASSLTLSGANDYSGQTAINAGTVIIGNETALGSTAGSTTITSGSILELNGFSIAEPIGNNINGSVIGSIINSSGTKAFVTGAVSGGNSDYSIGGSGDIDFVRITGNNGMDITKIGAGTVTLSGTEDNANNRMVVSTGTLVLAKDTGSGAAIGRGLTIADGAIAQLAGTSGNQIQNTVVTVNGTFDMNDRVETIGYLLGAGTGTITNTGSGTSKLTTADNNNVRVYDGSIVDGTGTVAFEKGGSSTQTITGTVSYSGGTTISAGILSLASATLSDTGALVINGTLNLTHSETDRVGSLTVGGLPAGDGVYGAVGSPAPVIGIAAITGTGRIQVGESVATPYDDWAALYAPADLTDTEGDNDNDGLTNQQEFAYGLNPTSGSSVNPYLDSDVAGGTFTYQRRIGTGLNYTIEVSENLDVWTEDLAASQVPTQIGATDNESVLVTPTGPLPTTKAFVRVKAE